jgi:hypothetical protein
MNKIIMMLVLSVMVSYPVWAADITDQKTAIEQKYDTQKNNENQNYAKQVADAKQNDYNDPTKLSNELKELGIKHSKNMADIENNEKMDLQKLSEQP